LAGASHGVLVGVVLEAEQQAAARTCAPDAGVPIVGVAQDVEPAVGVTEQQWRRSLALADAQCENFAPEVDAALVDEEPLRDEVPPVAELDDRARAWYLPLTRAGCSGFTLRLKSKRRPRAKRRSVGRCFG
jgi:hypothetical protein